jgi:hypothetical protein
MAAARIEAFMMAKAAMGRSAPPGHGAPDPKPVYGQSQLTGSRCKFLK